MFKVLSSQFEETQQTLKNVEENIRRLTGREPGSFNTVANKKWRQGDAPFRGANGIVLPRKRPMPFNKNALIAKQEDQEAEEEEEEESADEESPKKKPSLQSTIVATRKNPKSRKATLEAQKGDKRIFARNRRMFGMILGTLQKFQSEESSRKDQITKKAEVDKKVELAAEEEKEKMKKEKEQLFVTRKEKQIQIRCLEKKLEIAEIHDVWEQNQLLLCNFIQTTSQPSIMFLPSKHNVKSLKSLQDSKQRITAMISASREKFDNELLQIEECYNRNAEDIEMETAVDQETYMEGQYENNNSGDSQGVNLDNQPEDVIVSENPIDGDEGNSTIAMDVSDDVEKPERTENPDGAVKIEADETPDEDKQADDHDDFEPIYD